MLDPSCCVSLARLSSFILMVRGSHSKPMSRLREETDRLRAILLDCVAANEGEILYQGKESAFKNESIILGNSTTSM